ncbi:MAG: BrnT family toxin [Clostridiales Family XIII bacterium]|jgi:uncharacterized DUF497 family protein|nr:BrnT family toxin [Clostridiales Family XIII bacterium]
MKVIDIHEYYNYNVTTNGIHFSWDITKNSGNIAKHGVSFEEALTVFFDERYIEVDDPDHSIEEERFIALGFSEAARMITVSHSVIEDEDIEIYRIISARKATAAEIGFYTEINNARRI